ncbi:MAG TPA: hypothetical protein GXZ90_08590 [Clostridiales bacterium]|nr:hypothetical protein [Clostridiales bacterium]
MNKMPTLFKVNIEDKDEVKASKFISNLQKKGFIGTNKIYLKNYINADIGIALSHIKNNYKKYVCEGGWTEKKFEEIIYIIVKYRQMLIPVVFLRYGSKYDNGELVKEIELEKKKYSKINKDSNKNNEEQELLDYIAKHGGR